MNIQPNKAGKTGMSLTNLADMIKNVRMVSRMSLEIDKAIFVSFLIVTAVGALLMFVSTGAQALLQNELFHALSLHEVTTKLLLMIGLVSLAAFLPGFVHDLRNYLEQRFSIKSSAAFDLMRIRKYASLDPARLEQPAFQDVMHKANERGTGPLQQLFRGQFNILATLVGTVAAIIILIAMHKGLLVMMVLAAIVPTMIAKFRYGNDVWSIHEAEAPIKRRFYDIRHRFSQTANLSEIKLFQNARHFLTMITDLVDKFTMSQHTSQKRAFRAQTAASLIEELALMLALAILIIDGIADSWQLGTIFFAITSTRQLQSSLEAVCDTVGELHESSLFVTDIRKFYETTPVIAPKPDGIKLPRGLIPILEFDNVSFTYEGSKLPVLRNVSLRVAPGEIVAVVGENGAGKTTFSSLVAGIYDPSSGRVLIDGINMRDYDRETWRAELAVMSQLYMQYNFTIAEVIALGRTDIPLDRARAIEAARMSGADKFIAELENGYDEQIGKEFGGKNLSRGQSQRLALARIFYRQAAFVILDEPTAATDAKSEAAVFDTLYNNRQGRSAIIISHNFANVMKADRIYVFEKGVVAESGTHQGLMARGGLYATSFELQANRFKG